MDPFTFLVIGVGLLLLGGKKKGGGIISGTELLPDVNGDENGQSYDTEEEEDKRDTTNGEPDYKPGPIDKKELSPIDDSKYQTDLAALITVSPTPERFYQIYQGGPSASAIATGLLSAAGINSGSNRVALIKCMTQIEWNARLYASTRVASSWGTMFNVDGKNLSAAWMPRHDPAIQLMGMKTRVPRNINSGGGWLGGASKYGLIWIPKIASIQGSVLCDPLANNPPQWLLSQLKA